MLQRRPWVPPACEDLVQTVAAETAATDGATRPDRIFHLAAEPGVA